jgi:tetratricopeptide (TPR) repeat protein
MSSCLNLAIGGHHHLKVFSYLFVLLLFLLSLDPVSAQVVGAGRGDAAGSGGNRSIQGHVYTSTGKTPQVRIRITLDSTNSGTRTAITDEDGNFTFNNLAAGPYQIKVDAGKEYEISTESVYLEGGAPVYKVPIYLKLKPEANPALANVPKPAIAFYDKALETARAGDTKKAVEQLKAAIALQPDFALALSELGVQYMRLGQVDKAAEALQSAVKIKPDEFMPRLNYGIALMNQKKFIEAEEQLRLALKMNDSSPTAHMYLGIALLTTSRDEKTRQYDMEKYVEAQKELETAVSTGKDEVAMAHRYLGGIYSGNKDYKRAADEIETYLKLIPKAPDAEKLREVVKDLRKKG